MPVTMISFSMVNSPGMMTGPVVSYACLECLCSLFSLPEEGDRKSEMQSQSRDMTEEFIPLL